MTPKNEVNQSKKYRHQAGTLWTRALGPGDLRSKCWRFDCPKPAELHCEEGADVFLLCFKCAGSYLEKHSRGRALALTVPVGKHDRMWLAWLDAHLHGLLHLHRTVVARDADGSTFAIGCRDCGTYFWRRKAS